MEFNTPVSGSHSLDGEWSTSGLVKQLRDEVMQVMEKEVTEQEEGVQILLARGQVAGASQRHRAIQKQTRGCQESVR